MIWAAVLDVAPENLQMIIFQFQDMYVYAE